MEPNMGNNFFELQVDQNGSAYLKETARWAKFMAIVGFIFCGLIVIIAIFAGSILSGSLSRSFGSSSEVSGALGAVVSVVYILVALLYFFPCLYLYNFATKMQVALRSNDQEQLNQSLKNLKSCYRFIGILTVIALCFWALGILFAIIGAAFR
jgi:hypothetical protein